MSRSSQELPTRKNTRAQTLIRRLWTALETHEGRRITNQELSAYLNLPDSALSDWVVGKTELYQIEALLKFCERLEHSSCVELFRQHLRVYPTLRSPELAHDPAIAGRLRALLSQSAGFCLITGGTSSQRTFLLTALGHSYLEEGLESRSLVGWDIHEPSWFVPLPGVLYLPDERCEPLKFRVESIQRALILSNGLWECFGHHRAHLMRCASTHHVIVAAAVGADHFLQEMRNAKVPLHAIHITGGADRLALFVTPLLVD